MAHDARAEDPVAAAQAMAARATDRPYTLAQLGVGFLILPTADVCLKSRLCTKGDTSAEIDFWQLYRASPEFAIGAGASVGIKPTTDSPPSEAGSNATTRAASSWSKGKPVITRCTLRCSKPG